METHWSADPGSATAARATAGDIGSASYLYVVAFAIVAALVAVLALTLSGV